MPRIPAGFSIGGKLLLLACLFLLFFNGYRQSGPSRTKFKRLPSEEIDLTEVQEIKQPDAGLLEMIARKKKAREWERHWQQCLPQFSLMNLSYLGEFRLEEEKIEPTSVEEEKKGPGRMFYTKSPSGTFEINPYWGRLLYRKTKEGWQPVIETQCGALLFERKGHRARLLLRCSMFEGIDDALWLDEDRVALLGYESVTRQMDVECASLESCAAPAIWLLNLKTGWMQSFRGALISRETCQLERYLRKRLPRFFGKDA